jgi:hypothetical protein
VADDTAAIQSALNAAYGAPSSPNGVANRSRNTAVFFPGGVYRISSPLRLRSVRGAYIFGASRESTTIVNSTLDGSVFITNGLDYSTIERLSMVANGRGVAFDLDWDNTGPTALQGNSFTQCLFSGGTAGIGVRIGFTGYMGSENLFSNCHFSNLGAGLQTANYNALQNTVIGGNFQSCQFGIKVSAGSVPLVASTGFQVSGTVDIQLDGGTAADSMTLLNCRTESQNFLRNNVGCPVMIIGCGQTQPGPGFFASFIGALTMIGCYSVNGQVFSPTNNSGVLYGTSNSFGRLDYLATNQASIGAALTAGFDANRLTTNSSGALARATFASLPPAGPSVEGALVPVVDSSTATIGATITGGGTNHVLAYCNGTRWIVK